jgi:Iap family predicted aminopeptidase
MNPGLTKTYVADGDIPARAIVKAGSAEGTVAVATAATDAIIGVSERLDAADGDRVDVIHTGIAEIKLGGAVTYGDFLTAGALGVAVSAAPAAGVNARIAGMTLSSGVSGDIIDMLITLNRIQG